MTTPRPILIVEDDAALRATLAEQIMLAGEFHIVEAENAAEATAKLNAGDARYDAILLDLHGAMVAEPDWDGEGVLLEAMRRISPGLLIAVTSSTPARL